MDEKIGLDHFTLSLEGDTEDSVSNESLEILISKLKAAVKEVNQGAKFMPMVVVNLLCTIESRLSGSNAKKYRSAFDEVMQMLSQAHITFGDVQGRILDKLVHFASLEKRSNYTATRLNQEKYGGSDASKGGFVVSGQQMSPRDFQAHESCVNMFEN